jgi:hypothetical protein
VQKARLVFELKGVTMYALLIDVNKRAAILREAVACAAAIVIAEVFYKFHSFSLECLTFLATWTVLSGMIALAGRAFAKPREV